VRGKVLEANFEQLNNVEIIKESLDKALVHLFTETFRSYDELERNKSFLQKIALF
jgi:DNA repair protein RecN (Recombination protein N)